jgi:hypothetical protein
MANVNAHTGFELYLEGVQTPFSSIRITEREGSVPTCSIQLPGTNGSLRILPATIVQIFGPYDNETILLFEGEVSQVGYQKGFQGRSVNLEAVGIMDTVFNTSIRPAHSLVYQKRSSEEGNFPGGANSLIIDASDIQGIRTNRQGLGADSTEAYIKENFDNIDLSGVMRFFGTFNDLLNNETQEGNYITEGEFHYLIQFFLRYYEESNLYYGMLSKSLRIPDSVFSWPNAKRTNLFRNRMIINQWQSVLSQMEARQSSREMVLSELIQSFSQTLLYNYSSPASPTYGHLFWRNSQDKGPIRLQFTPDLDNSPPINSNVYFPSQVASFSYRRNLRDEPTRIIGEVQIPMISSSFQEYGVLPTYTAPSLDITAEQVKNNSIGFTTEETYRGIKSFTVPLDPLFRHTFQESVQKIKVREQAELNPSDVEDLFTKDSESTHIELRGVRDVLQQMTIDQYLRGKYQGRIATAVVDWNPNRMIGFPCLIMEEEAPSIAGVLSSISTTIDSNGNANSTINVRSPRLVYTDSSIFNHSDSDSDVVNDFTNDMFTNTNHTLYDPDLYSFTNVGKDFYNYVMYGTGTQGDGKLSGSSEAEGFRSMSDNIAGIDKIGIEDSSILSVLYEEGEIKSHLIREGDSAEVQLGKLVTESTQRLKEFYNRAKNDPNEPLHRKLKRFGSRRLVTKQEYFNFIGVQLRIDGRQAEDGHYKDSVEVIKGGENLAQIKTVLEKDTVVSGATMNQLNGKIQSRQRDLEYYREVRTRIQSTPIPFSFRDYVEVRRRDLEEFYHDTQDQLREEYEADLGLSVIQSIIDRLEEELEQFESERESIVTRNTRQTLAEEILKPYNLIRKNHIVLGVLQDFHKVKDLKVIY